MIDLLELRPEVAAFAQLMEKALRENDYKGGWSDCEPAALLRRLREESIELDHALSQAHDRVWRDWDPEAHKADATSHRQVTVSYVPNRGWLCTDICSPKVFQPDADAIERIGEEAADVANFAMMIADNAGALK